MQQRAYERKQILSIKDYEYTLPVQVEIIVDHHYQIASQGILHLRNDQIIYQSEDHFSYTIPTSGVRYVPFDARKNFQIYIDNRLYQFLPPSSLLINESNDSYRGNVYDPSRVKGT